MTQSHATPLTDADMELIRSKVLADPGFTDVRITEGGDVQAYGTPHYSKAPPGWWFIHNAQGLLSGIRSGALYQTGGSVRLRRKQP